MCCCVYIFLLAHTRSQLLHFCFHLFFFFFTFASLAQPTRYVGRKPHRYKFSAATNNIHNVDVSPDQVKVYLNSGGHAKGNGTGPGVTYNKVFISYRNLLIRPLLSWLSYLFFV